ncbi:hypothetical protein CSKR_112670 [Clonorchis sinensis]|uniref:Uncharacterized protein n=1 Tax=Clonorchis sinensis TaxID=79923 RepID=A0A3R7GR10_CLOSI|nr:hypothetical protein CSKR_112670 [Clonorchis sinensis]
MQEELTIPREPSRSQTYHSPRGVVGVTRPTHFRRCSFALSGESQTNLGNLVDSALLELPLLRQCRRQLLYPYPEPAITAYDGGFDSEPVSVSTILAGQSGSSAVFH